ncbi:hypothetical protein DL93DRAFT_2161369 [Clavulina sp. PMI_390]|nr:hypothetical protein DL93DRAFT_2161369 [Clavulina sp. PMI_390]
MSSSPLWLQRINLDVIYILNEWLDPLSIVQLSRLEVISLITCKVFQAVIGDDRHTWLRALQRVAAEHCTSPHSFDNLSISDLKAFATRPARLVETLQDPKQTIYAGMRECFLSDKAHLQPIAMFAWEGLRPPSKDRWMQAQLYDSEHVMVASRLGDWESTLTSSFSILRIGWTSDSNSPTIQDIARLDLESYPILDMGWLEYHLEGDYLLLDTIRSLVVWDWKNDGIGIIDSEQHHWAAQSRTDCIRPPTKVTYPFIAEFAGHRSSKIHVFDTWKPPSSRSGLAILYLKSRGWMGDHRFYIISLHPTDAIPPCPNHVEQPKASLPGTKEFESMVLLDGVGIALLKSPPFSDSRERLDTLLYRCADSGRLHTPQDRDYDDFFPAGGFPMPFDFVSGTALLNSRDVAPKPELQVVEIISFDFQNPGSQSLDKF